MNDLWAAGERVAAKLKARGETVAVIESSAGGLISAALLRVPGASAYFLGGGVIYTKTSIREFAGLDMKQLWKEHKIRSSSEPFAKLLSERIRASHETTWGLAETGAAGPGNGYGDAAGHSCQAVTGPANVVVTLETGEEDRGDNMVRFAIHALDLFARQLDEPLTA
ncbi:MAG: CinA family protein [Minwuia sp.]|uniref:CinA family protein n=1 Tax=Minwuia sp. TaxID=2493630 RepID=UPI003A8B1770